MARENLRTPCDQYNLLMIYIYIYIYTYIYICVCVCVCVCACKHKISRQDNIFSFCGLKLFRFVVFEFISLSVCLSIYLFMPVHSASPHGVVANVLDCDIVVNEFGQKVQL